MKTKLVSLKAIDREWKRLIDWDVDDADLLAMGTSAVKKVITPEQFRSPITLINIENYRGDLPEDLAFIAQAAYNIKPESPCTIKQISQWTQKGFNDCDIEINLKCHKCGSASCDCNDHILEIPMDELEKMANPQVHSYMKHYYSHGGITKYGHKSFYHEQFALMKYKTGYFHNLDYHITNCINLNVDCDVAYQIKDGKEIVTNFKKGQVLLSYLAYPTDKDGIILVPDVEEVWEAIIYYIAERIAFSEYFVDPSQKNTGRWERMDLKRAQTIGRARMRLRIPDSDQWDSLITNHWYKIVPYVNQWENSNKLQGDQFHHPRI
jgi:hypothetical protein